MTILKKNTRQVGNALDELELQRDICGKPVAFFASGLPRHKEAKGNFRSKRVALGPAAQKSSMTTESGQVEQSTCLCLTVRFLLEVSMERG
jgi:hypothetical protein